MATGAVTTGSTTAGVAVFGFRPLFFFSEAVAPPLGVRVEVEGSEVGVGIVC